MISDRDIRHKILETRKRSIREKGFTQGLDIPAARTVPVVAPPEKRILICEIKRGSPSRGLIGSISDPAKQAGLYIEGGADIISVLTEEHHFLGSLQDLMDIKNEYPGQALLRKDFLFSPEDVEVSYRAGADLILLIASILDKDKIVKMYNRVKDLGIEAIVEVHNKDDIEKISDFKPNFVGINSRDLRTFKVDLTLPLKIKNDINWNPSLIFESGMRYPEDMKLAISSGFNGVLVGESVVRNPDLVRQLKNAMNEKKVSNFWERLYSESKEFPLIKICGLTTPEDVLKADELGADILGFILAESPRQADIAFIRNLPPTKALKAGVVVLKSREEKLPEAVKQLMNEGKLDVIQFHGDEDPDKCSSIALPYYKAVRINTSDDIPKIETYRSPRVLIDAYSDTGYGGTGKQIKGKLVSSVKEKQPLWLAGGISPDNVEDLIQRFNPELIDISSSLEESPGKKDHKKMEQLFKVCRRKSGQSAMHLTKEIL